MLASAHPQTLVHAKCNAVMMRISRRRSDAFNRKVFRGMLATLVVGFSALVDVEPWRLRAGTEALRRDGSLLRASGDSGPAKLRQGRSMAGPSGDLPSLVLHDDGKRAAVQPQKQRRSRLQVGVC
eukprot:515868-Rhodomonas_salina.1